MTQFFLSVTTIMSCLFTSYAGWAVDIDVNIRGEINIPPCTVNQNNPLDIDFGTLAAHRINGTNYAQQAVLNISCSYFSGTPYVKFSGSALSGDQSNVLQTDADSLGIALYLGEHVDSQHKITLNPTGLGQQVTAGLNIYNSSIGQLTVTAVPYRYGSRQVVPGVFNASAMISFIYN